jgi:acyl-CoA synthetase (AMP-forming)/AMP-acid ligase II
VFDDEPPRRALEAAAKAGGCGLMTSSSTAARGDDGSREVTITLAMNHSRHVVAWYGAIGMGGVIHTINPRLFDDQLVYIANHAEDRVLFYDKAFAAAVERLKPRWTSIEHFICFDDGEFDALIAAESDDYEWVEGDEREPACSATPAAPPAIPRACSTSIARPCSTPWPR